MLKSYIFCNFGKIFSNFRKFSAVRGAPPPDLLRGRAPYLPTPRIEILQAPLLTLHDSRWMLLISRMMSLVFFENSSVDISVIFKFLFIQIIAHVRLFEACAFTEIALKPVRLFEPVRSFDPVLSFEVLQYFVSFLNFVLST